MTEASGALLYLGGPVKSEVTISAIAGRQRTLENTSLSLYFQCYKGAMQVAPMTVEHKITKRGQSGPLVPHKWHLFQWKIKLPNVVEVVFWCNTSDTYVGGT